ncbi:MAG: polysaccharide deacetylase family protein [Solirubrobacteraceae bacterium]
MSGVVWAGKPVRRAARPVRAGLELALARALEERARRSSAVRGAALVFHGVADQDGDYDREIDPAVAADRLDAAVGYLARRYRLVRASELPEAARARRPGEPVPVALTFDDDLPSHRERAAPVLARHGAVATAFLCGADAPFWWQLLQRAIDTRAVAAGGLPPVAPAAVQAALDRRPGAIAALAGTLEAMTPEERDALTERLRAAVPEPQPVLATADADVLAGQGWEIGFHTRRHDLLTRLPDDALREAVARPEGATSLAYPHGKATAREAGAARDAGYTAAYTGAPGVLTERTDACLIGRLQPRTATVGRFALDLARAVERA